MAKQGNITQNKKFLTNKKHIKFNDLNVTLGLCALKHIGHITSKNMPLVLQLFTASTLQVFLPLVAVAL